MFNQSKACDEAKDQTKCYGLYNFFSTRIFRTAKLNPSEPVTSRLPQRLPQPPRYDMIEDEKWQKRLYYLIFTRIFGKVRPNPEPTPLPILRISPTRRPSTELARDVRNDNTSPETSHGAIPNGLESYVYMPLVPFLPYLEKTNHYLQYSDYLYKQPDGKWIDLNVLENWIKNCDTYHANHCQTPSTIGTTVSSERPLWVIDVRRSCLVAAKHIHRYVALSYVWSRAEATSATLANLSILQKDQALTNKLAVLPRTVTHAIGLTRMLGETYLWVDRLCIVQDDERTRSAQLDLMAAIYANSYFTIVAAQGDDADAGLRGIPIITPLRQLVRPDLEDNFPQRRPLEYENHFEAITTQANELMDTNWYTRGWTFQEQLFSRRKIVFHNDTVNWECHCAAWYENQQLNNKIERPCNRKPLGKSMGFHTTPWPDLYRYARLVSLYNQRSLTYPEDVLNAFAGVISTLGPAFDGGFICGLPQMFFDSALLWQPYQPLERRVVISSQEKLPSWSWIGWCGDLHSESWRSSYDYMRPDPDQVPKIDQEGCGIETWSVIRWRTESKVQWFYSRNLKSRKYPINVSSQKYRKGDLINLPEGWTSFQPKLGRRYYQHFSDPNQRFHYPIPVLESFKTEPPTFQPLFLHAHTRRCSLKFGATFTNPETSECLSCDLLDKNDRWAGALRLNLSSSSTFNDEQRECSLIQLSFGSVRNQKADAIGFDEWYRPDCPKRVGFYEFYNVIWIDESGGVAYRKALGRVVKSVWEKCSVETDITLG